MTVAPIHPAQPAIAAVVLAAGWSSRMEAFKPLLPFGAGTVVEHIVWVLRQAGIEQIHVVYGHRADEMAPKLASLGVTSVHNLDFDQGMYSSIKAGIASLPETVTNCLLLPVDVPLLRASTIGRVVKAAAEGGAAVIHPTFHGTRGHPPVISRALFSHILRYDGAGGLRALLAMHESATQEIAVFDWGCLADMDTREDYYRLTEALARHRQPDTRECDALFAAAGTPMNIRRHCRAVAGLATTIAERLAAAGMPLDIDLVHAAALVHDIAKGHWNHAEAGAELLQEFGFPDVAEIVARHMTIGFDGRTIDEAAVVYLADKLFLDEKCVSLEQRFAPAFKRFTDDPLALAGARQRLADAQAILHAVEALIGPLDGAKPAPTIVEGAVP